MTPNFVEYQANSRKTADYPDMGTFHGAWYCATGLCGEAGEVMENIKKTIRDDGKNITPERLAAIEKEMGDVLWYLAGLATELGLRLDDVARTNLYKINDRRSRGVINGSGDNR